MRSKPMTTKPRKLSDWNLLLDKSERNLKNKVLMRLLITFIIALSSLMLLSGCGKKDVIVSGSPKVSVPASYKNDYQKLPAMILPGSSSSPSESTVPAESSTMSSGDPTSVQ